MRRVGFPIVDCGFRIEDLERQREDYRLRVGLLVQVVLWVSQIVISFCYSLISTSYQWLTLCDFKSVIQMKKGMAELTDTQITAMLRSYLKKILAEDERDRALGKKNWTAEEGLDEHVDAMAYLRHDCERELAIGNYSRATGAVDRLLAEKEIELDRDGLSYKKLCRGMMKVMIEHLEIDMKRNRND